jgi:hypothetical protein
LPMIGAIPWRANETACFAGVKLRGRIGFKFFQREANVVPQVFEPYASLLLALFERGEGFFQLVSPVSLEGRNRRSFRRNCRGER